MPIKLCACLINQVFILCAMQLSFSQPKLIEKGLKISIG